MVIDTNSGGVRLLFLQKSRNYRTNCVQKREKLLFFLHMWNFFRNFARFFVSTIFDHRENISLERTLTC